jgi:hypothetical protein
MKELKDVKDLKGKRVLLRSDFNVPIKDGKILDFYRIERAISTIDFLQKGGAKIVIISHIESDDIQFNVSPKLANSLNVKSARIRKDVIKALNSHSNSWFKFVVMKPEDIKEIEEDYVKGCGILRSKIILMPQGVTEQEVYMNMRNVAEIAKERGYRLLGRLQVSIWGARRRV